MLKKLLSLGICTLMIGGSVSAMGPIQSQVRSFEVDAGLQDSTIYTNITYTPVRRILEQSCSDVSLRKARQIEDLASDLVARRYNTDGAYLLTDTQQLYTLIETLQQRIRSQGDEKYCTSKYVLNALQLQLREIHLDYMEQTGLIDEFEGVNELDPIINAFDAKLGILEGHIKTYRTALGRLGTRIDAEILNPRFLDTLSTEQKLLTQKAQELMEVMIAHAMLELKQRNFLTQDEINDLSSKIQYEYVAACGVFNGKYEVRQTFRFDELVSQSPNSLTLKVNLCPSFFVIRDVPDIYNKIITHELGHHVYYFKDDMVDAYQNICRQDEDMRNGVCMSEDFVTPYATTNSLEDYAEQFMYWFLDLERNQSRILTTKENHFDRLESSLR